MFVEFINQKNMTQAVKDSHGEGTKKEMAHSLFVGASLKKNGLAETRGPMRIGSAKKHEGGEAVLKLRPPINGRKIARFRRSHATPAESWAMVRKVRKPSGVTGGDDHRNIVNGTCCKGGTSCLGGGVG